MDHHPAGPAPGPVADTLAAGSRNEKSANPPPNFSFVRVTIPSKIKFSLAYPAGLKRNKEAASDIYPAGSGGRALPALEVSSIWPAPAAARFWAARRPPHAFIDPMHKGESLRDDHHLVTVLAVVMLDPPKPPAKAETHK